MGSYLNGGMEEGWADFSAPDWETPDFGTVSRLKQNIFVFSGAKTHSLLKEMSSLLLTEDDKVKSYSKFKADALQVWEKYNLNWLQSEYNHAIASSQMAARWSEYEKDSDVTENLQYYTAGDDRVRDAHRALDGIVKPINDPFWRIYYPPNDWGCRCGARQTFLKVTNRAFNAPNLKEMFKNNVYKDGVVFPSSHPYFDDLSRTAAVLGKEIQAELMSEMYVNAYKGKKGGNVKISLLHNPSEIDNNMRVAKMVADNGHKVRLPPYSFSQDVKSPDFNIDGHIAEHKAANINSKRYASNAIRDANKQGASIVILEPAAWNSDRMEGFIWQVKGALNPNRNKNIKAVWFIWDARLYKYTRDEVLQNKHIALFKTQ